MPTTEQKQRGYAGVRNATIQTLLPSPEDLAAAEPGVEVMRTPHGVPFVRTPDTRFDDLPGYAFAPNYVDRAPSRRNDIAWGGLARFTRPFLHVRGTLDKQFGTQELQDDFVHAIPGARGQPHTALEAGHYIQDNQGETLAGLLIDFITRNPMETGPAPRIPRQ